MGDTLDISTSGISIDNSIGYIHPFFILIPGCIIAIFLILLNYQSISKQLVTMRSVQRSGVHISAILPGIGFGLTLAIVLNLIGYPDIVSRWTNGSYHALLLTTLLFLFLLLSLNQFGQFKEIILHPVVHTIINLLQLLILFDILYLRTNVIHYLQGIALYACLINIYIFYQAIGIKNYSIQYYIRMITTGIIVFLVMSFIIGFTFTWSYIGPAGSILQGNMNLIIIFSSIIYSCIAIFYNSKTFRTVDSTDS